MRPRDLADHYANPAKELARLHDRDVVVRFAHGYYVIPPAQFLGLSDWRPTIEALTLGVAAADYGPESVALMGPSAARLHGAVPRAIAVGSVAVPKQRPPLETRWGLSMFHRRDVSTLDLERVDTALTAGYQTTVEQTVLDLARWGGAWDASPDMIIEAIGTLASRTDWSALHDLAVRQRVRAAYVRAVRVAGDIARDAPPMKVRGPVNANGVWSSEPSRG